MTKNKFHKRRLEAATALRSMGNLLSNKGVCIDVSPLNSAAEQVSQSGKKDASWSYEIHDLTFKLSPPKTIYPSTAYDFKVALSLQLAGQFTSNNADQFTSMVVNVEKYAIGKGGVQLKSAWHFDRHFIDTAENDPYITADIHPLYHFQFGGAKMVSVSDNLGGTFLVDPPRIMHPPLDGILAIDFVLSNYGGVSWKQLREDGRYANLVDAKLEELWKPYFSSISTIWQNPREHLSSFLCPSAKQ